VGKLVLIFFLFVSSQETFSAAINWYDGSLVLRNDKVLTGKISVNQDHDLVLFKSGDQFLVLPASKIQTLHFYDAHANINRKFTSIQQKVNTFTAYNLYEIVLVGKVSVLRRLSSSLADPDDQQNSYHYFVGLGNERVALHQFRSKIYPYLQKTCISLKKYVREQHWDPNNRAHAILIIDYYNDEVRSKTALAMH
jgi:hypothetical protein